MAVKLASNICVLPQVMPTLREFHSDELPSRYSQFNNPFRSRSKRSALLRPFGPVVAMWQLPQWAGSWLGSTAADITAGVLRVEALGAPVAGVTTSGTWREHLILRAGPGCTLSAVAGVTTSGTWREHLNLRLSAFAGATTSGTWREHIILRAGPAGTLSAFVGRFTLKGWMSLILVRRFAGGGRLGVIARCRRTHA